MTSFEPFLLANYTFDDPVGSTIAVDDARYSARPTGIISWWRGEGNSRDSVQQFPSGLIGGVTFGAGVTPDRSAFQFDGVNDYVSIPDNPSQKLTAAVSLDAWVYPTEYKIGVIVGKAFGYELHTLSDGRVRFFVHNSAQLNSALPLPLNTWSHVAGTFHRHLWNKIRRYRWQWHPQCRRNRCRRLADFPRYEWRQYCGSIDLDGSQW